VFDDVDGDALGKKKNKTIELLLESFYAILESFFSLFCSLPISRVMHDRHQRRLV
jgi:hypothetical protein